MDKYKVVFVILHYYTIDDTIKCVEHIKKLENYKDEHIVIVDNCSPNKTGEQLKQKYEKDNNMHIILSKKNLGFANGNNLGYRYAKDKLKADFIVMCNNDTKIIDNEFLKKILNKYKEYKYAVLGPKIKLKDGQVNKLYLKLPTVQDFNKEIKYFKKMLVLNYLHLEVVLRNIKHKIKPINIEEADNVNKFQKNIILHGCFWVFSPKYIEKFDGLDDRTFMYREEELLSIRLIKNDLISVYCPDIEIYHDEYGSTKAINKTSLMKNRFFYINQLKSCKIVLDELINLNR